MCENDRNRYFQFPTFDRKVNQCLAALTYDQVVPFPECEAG